MMAVFRSVAMTLRNVAGTDLGAVLVIDDVADPLGAVLDAPMSFDPGGQDRRWRGAVVSGDDHIDDLDGLLPAAGAGAADLGDLGGRRRR
jgi:hypothetical protein